MRAIKSQNHKIQQHNIQNISNKLSIHNQIQTWKLYDVVDAYLSIANRE